MLIYGQYCEWARWTVTPTSSKSVDRQREKVLQTGAFFINDITTSS